MYCKACGNYVGYKKKKPATTFTTVNSICKESVVEGFPKDELEDLCSVCLITIRDFNSDMSVGFGEYYDMKPVRIDNFQDKMVEECSDLRMDVEFEYVQSQYDGGNT